MRKHSTTKKIKHERQRAFSLTEVLIALLVVTITLSALAPVLTKKVISDKAVPSSKGSDARRVWNDLEWMKFHWGGESGQPSWLWGGNSASDMYTYNPSDLSVKHATDADTAAKANNADTLGGYTVAQIIAVAKSEAEVSQGSGNLKVWVSGEYTPVANTPTIVNHGISGLDPLKARGEVLLKCVVAEHGYSVGDFADSPHLTTGTDGHVAMPFVPTLSLTTIRMNTAYSTAGNIKAFSKSNYGAWVSLTLANWRYIFRIWYIE